MVFALHASFLTLVITDGQQVCSAALLGCALCLTLLFGFHNNRRRFEAIQAGTEDTGKVVYVDSVGCNWLSLLSAPLVVGLLISPWFLVLEALHLPIYRFYTALGLSTAWSVCASLIFPTQYVITTKGIWFRAGTVHSFVYFEDLEYIYREPGKRFVWPSDKSNPVVRFGDYIILSIRPERKLLKESQQKYLTPSKPLEFMVYLPSQLVRGAEINE